MDEAGIIAAQQRKLKCSILAPKGFRWRDRKGNEKEGRNVFVNRFKEECIDFEAWEKADPEGSRSWGLTKFNGRNELEMLKFEIDLRIMHMNERASNGFG